MKKIEDFVNRHPNGVVLTTLALAVLITIPVAHAIAVNCPELILPILIVLCIIAYIYMGYVHFKNAKALKKVKKGFSISELKDFYSEQLDAVNQALAEYSYSVSNDHDWLFTFDKTVRSLLLAINNSRAFSSFEFASCLIYSLIVAPVVKLEDPTSQLLFAFSCAKKLIDKPTFYNVDTTYPAKVLQNFKKVDDNEWKEASFDFPNEVFTAKVICEIIKAYTSSGESKDLLQFSDLLQKMHSMCSNK